MSGGTTRAHSLAARPQLRSRAVAPRSRAELVKGFQGSVQLLSRRAAPPEPSQLLAVQELCARTLQLVFVAIVRLQGDLCGPSVAYLLDP